MEKHIVRKSIDIKASPEKVWRALTDPEITKKYFFNCKVFSDWKPGSAITFKGRMFFVFKIELKGKILEIEKYKHLKYQLQNSGGGSDNSVSTVTDELSFKDGITTVSIRDDVGSGEGAGRRFRRSEKGWDKILRGLKKIAESEI